MAALMAGALAGMGDANSEVSGACSRWRHRRRERGMMTFQASAEFGSVVDAVACTVAMQRSVAERQAAIPPQRRIMFPMGASRRHRGRGEDLLGDGVNFATRHHGSMSIPAGTRITPPPKSQRIFSAQVAGSPRMHSAPPAPIAQAVRKVARSHFLGDRALPITCRRSSPRT
jgi:hypothetical protein